MSKRMREAPVDPTGRIVTLTLAALVIVGLIVLIVLSFIHQNAPVAVSGSPTPAPTPTELPRPAQTPGTHFKAQGHQGHDKTSGSDPT